MNSFKPFVWNRPDSYREKASRPYSSGGLWSDEVFFGYIAIATEAKNGKPRLTGRAGQDTKCDPEASGVGKRLTQDEFHK